MGLAKSNKSGWSANVVERLRAILVDMGWEEKTLSQEIHKQLGLTPKAVEKYFYSDSIPAFSIFYISEHLGISTDYLMLRTDNIDRAIDKHGLYARESAREEKVRTALGGQQATPRKASI